MEKLKSCYPDLAELLPKKHVDVSQLRANRVKVSPEFYRYINLNYGRMKEE